jgi:hypothetical protein
MLLILVDWYLDLKHYFFTTIDPTRFSTSSYPILRDPSRILSDCVIHYYLTHVPFFRYPRIPLVFHSNSIMKGLLKKAKVGLHGILDSDQVDDNPSAQETQTPFSTGQLKGMADDKPNTIGPVTPLDIVRYRYHHGCNLGSVYVLERWLRNSMFPSDASGSSELEAVEAWVRQIGVDKTREKFEAFWSSAVTDDDLAWLVNVAKGKLSFSITCTTLWCIYRLLCGIG